MIIVKPSYLVCRHHIKIYRKLVDWAQCQRFELQEWSEFSFTIRHYKKNILCTASEFSGKIYSRFISYSHILQQWSRHPIHSKLVRSLVNIQKSPDAMSGTMQIVKPSLPHKAACKNIQLCT